jgi:aminobenzoyl-glutamate transport protein
MNNSRSTVGVRILDAIERIGNKLPDPVTLFFIGAILVLIGSEIAVRAGWQIAHPTEDRFVQAKSLLSREGMQWVWLNLVKNFTGFHPLGVVLVAMIGIGVAERSGLIGALLKGMVQVTPRNLLTPAVIFVGVNSSVATDAGYVVLPPLAAMVFAKSGRSPLVGLAAVFAGVASGFSANLLLTGLDPLLQGLTETSAQLLDKHYHVRPDCNYYFMFVSTFVITLTCWAVTKWVVQKRYDKQAIAEQIAHANLPGLSGDATAHERLEPAEIKGLWAALGTVLIAGGGILALVLIPEAPLHGTYPKPPSGKPALVWPDTIVPMLFVLFLLPGIAFGICTGTIRNDRDAAKMMGESMAGMGMYIVLAFFAAQFVEWFRESNLGLLVALQGALFLENLGLQNWQLLIAIVLLVAALNLFLGSASAKWALVSPVLVPMMMRLGVSPELMQATYRVGDSVTNSIAPLNPYLVVILVFMQKYLPKAGLGSLVALMLPYAITLMVVWTALLLIWIGLDLPLGPGREPLFLKK